MTIEDALRAGVHWSGGQLSYYRPEIGNEFGVCRIGLEGEAVMIEAAIKTARSKPTYLKFGEKKYRLDRDTMQLELEETTQ